MSHFAERGSLSKEVIEMAPMQRVDEVREKLRLIKRLIADIYEDESFYFADRDSLLYTLCGVSEAVDDVTRLIEEDELGRV
jgi:hypothetical protein